MAAPIIEFVDVTVNLAGAVASKFSFGTLLGTFTHDQSNNRIDGPYFSITEVNDAGFTATNTPEINTWASDVFAQDDGVDSLLIGRRIPSTGGSAAQVWQVAAVGPVFVDITTEYNDATVADFEPFPAAEALGDYFAVGMSEPFAQIVLDNTGGTAGTVGTVDWEYWDGAAWQALGGVVDGTTGFTAGPSAGQTVSWTVPGDWAPVALGGSDPLYYVRAVVTLVYTVDPVYDSGTAAGDATWTATMDNIEQWGQLNGSPSWYINNIESRVDTDILLVDAWVSARDMIFMAQTSDADLLQGTPGNIGLDLQALGTVRTALWYHADDAEYLDGAIASSGGGLNLDVPGGVGIWAYRQLESVSFDNVTGAQATNIYAADANLYGRNLGLSFTSKGTMAAGEPRFIDVTTSIDWTKKRMQEAVLALFVGTPTKIPYTNAGINTVVGAVQGVLDQGVTFGHFSPDVPPSIVVPDISTISAADKGNRVLTLTATAVLAGAIQKLTLVVQLSF